MPAGNHIQDGTGYGLIIFLDQAPKKGWINQTTARSYRAAVTQILQVIAPDLGEIDDVRKIEVETVLREFEDVRGDDYTEGSLASYKTRFRKAIEMYVQFLEDPESVQRVSPRVRAESLRAAEVSDLLRRPRAEVHEPVHDQLQDWVQHAAPRADEMIEYPFPLTDGGTAYLRLPRNLLAPDVERLTAFLKSIAIKPRGQGTLPLMVPKPE